MSIGAHHTGGRTADSGGLVRRAWLAIASIPVFLVLGFATGEATLALLGHPSGGDIPVWANVLADVTAVAVCSIPAATGVLWGMRARQAGAARAALPISIGAVAIATFVLLAVVTEMGNAM